MHSVPCASVSSSTSKASLPSECRVWEQQQVKPDLFSGATETRVKKSIEGKLSRRCKEGWHCFMRALLTDMIFWTAELFSWAATSSTQVEVINPLKIWSDTQIYYLLFCSFIKLIYWSLQPHIFVAAFFKVIILYLKLIWLIIDTFFCSLKNSQSLLLQWKDN